MRISDWSSDVCSSDLPKDQGFLGRRALRRAGAAGIPFRLFAVARDGAADGAPLFSGPGRLGPAPDRWRDNGQRADRKSVVSGMSVSVRVDLGGRRLLNKKKTKKLDKNLSATSW